MSNSPTATLPAPVAKPAVLVGPTETGFISGEQLKARIALIYDVMKHVMEEGVDFGTIPGTDKPSLWKPGAEKLCVAFRIAAGEPVVEDLSTADEIRYRVKVPGLNQTTGDLLGVGIGECSTSEKKYRWRSPVHPKEYDATPPDRRRLVFKRDGTTYQQVRTDPADLANTVLKMAHKRALVAMTLVVTGASAVFSQDLEELPEEVREAVAAEEGKGTSRKRPQRASETGTGKANGKANGKAANGAPRLVSDPVKVTSVDEKDTKGGKIYWIRTSDGHNYSTFDANVANELRTFAGTDHRVRITYETRQIGEKTFRNFVDVTVADGAPAATPSSSPAPQPAPAPAQPASADPDFDLSPEDFGDFSGS